MKRIIALAALAFSTTMFAAEPPQAPTPRDNELQIRALIRENSQLKLNLIAQIEENEKLQEELAKLKPEPAKK